MTISVAQYAGVLLACAAAAASLLLVDPRRRYGAMAVGLTAALGLIAGEAWDQPRFAELRAQPGALALAGVLAGTALGATAATFARVPAAFAIAAFAVLPLRVPVQVGGETNFLLVPLYGVIAGGLLRAGWLCAKRRGAELQTASAPSRADPPVVRWLCVALAASLVVYGVGAAWSDDPDNAVRTVAFFLAPFAALFALLRDLRWHRKLVGQVLAVAVAVALGFAAFALYQHGARDLFLNKDLADANELHLYFRVNSLFRDPNVLGRYLVFALVALAAWIAWRRPGAQALAGGLAAAVLLAALTFTYSQTSFAALIAALGLLAWLRCGRRGLAGAGALVVSAVAALALVGGPPSDSSTDRERGDLAERSSGRSGLISGGIELWERAPLVGQGSGSFAASYRREIELAPRPISHTEPVTVAAEQGLLGLIPYVAVLALSGLLIVRPWPGSNPARAGVAACYAALLVHSLGYAGFAIDPATWGLLALAVALRE